MTDAPHNSSPDDAANAAGPADAAEWLARMDGAPLSADEEARFAQWLDADPGHAQELAELAAIWDGLGDTALDMPAIAIEDLVAENEDVAVADETEEQMLAAAENSALSLPDPANENEPTWRRYAFAATLAVALLAAFFLLVTPARDGGEARFAENYTTAVGEQLAVNLPDGSVAHLNTGTRLSTRFSGDERFVELQAGEAHFAIAKDPARPFRVMANGRIVEAVGTEFSVRLLEGEEIEVIVNEGRVKLAETAQDDPARTRFLAAGERFVGTVGAPQVAALGTSEIEDALAWQKGELVFDGEPLSAVVAELSRYTTKRIVITDPAVSERPVGGYFLSSQAEDVLASLGPAFGLKVEYGAEEITISDARR